MKAAMHDPRRAVKVNRQKPSSRAARLRALEADAINFRSAKNRRDDERRSGTTRAVEGRATRRDQRALKGKKSSREEARESGQAVQGKTPRRMTNRMTRAGVTRQAKDVARGPGENVVAMNP
jgi:hypothetical protein